MPQLEGKLTPGDDLGLRRCSCWLCDPHKSENKRRLEDKRRTRQLVSEELQAEAEIRSEYERLVAAGWGREPWLEKPKW